MRSCSRDASDDGWLFGPLLVDGKISTCLGSDLILVRQMKVGSDDGSDHGSDCGSDHGSDHGSDRGSDHGQDHGSDRGSDHGSDHGKTKIKKKRKNIVTML